MPDQRVQLGEQAVAVHAHLAEERRDESAVLIDKGIEQMLGGQILVAVLLRHALRGLDGVQRFLGIFFSVHINSPLLTKLRIA